MSARTLRDELMGNITWIRNHVGSCVESISQVTFLNTLLPIIENAVATRQKQIDFEKRVAKLAQDNLRSQNEISKTVDCVNGKVIHEAKSRGLPTFETFYLPLSCALLGRFLYDICMVIGYFS